MSGHAGVGKSYLINETLKSLMLNKGRTSVITPMPIQTRSGSVIVNKGIVATNIGSIRIARSVKVGMKLDTVSVDLKGIGKAIDLVGGNQNRGIPILIERDITSPADQYYIQFSERILHL